MTANNHWSVLYSVCPLTELKFATGRNKHTLADTKHFKTEQVLIPEQTDPLPTNWGSFEKSVKKICRN